MNRRTRLFIVGVDGLDFDVLHKLSGELPNLSFLARHSHPMSSTFPPDSVPSWTTIFTGLEPHEHGMFHSRNYVLDTESPGTQESVEPFASRLFWTGMPEGERIVVLNPFLAHPAFLPGSAGAMVSAPAFSEGPASIVDPTGSLVGEPPVRMGGFTTVPRQAELEKFAEQTEAIAEAQYRYALRQIQSRAWDVVFHTTLTVDRIQHFAWRHYDRNDPTFSDGALAHLIPSAYRQLDRFVGEARSALAADHTAVVFSDHGHGPRASVGVNLHELFRRNGLYVLPDASALRRVVETAKTYGMGAASICHLEDPAIWVAKRLPGKAALKSGRVAGQPIAGSAVLSDLGGSNPYGGVRTGGSDRVAEQAIGLLESLEFHGEAVIERVGAVEDILGHPAGSVFPDLVFEMKKRFAPTWNLYGPIFAPIITRRRLSGGHTRRGVFASSDGRQATSSAEVHWALRDLCSSGTRV
jgi:predicted AlkP superfamily phosphohydrolase/phosphomutase